MLLADRVQCKYRNVRVEQIMSFNARELADLYVLFNAYYDLIIVVANAVAFKNQPTNKRPQVAYTSSAGHTHCVRAPSYNRRG